MLRISASGPVVCFVISVLHCKNLILLIEEFIFHYVLAWFAGFELFQFLVEAVAVLDDGYPGAAYEFDEAIGFQDFDELVGLLSLPGGLEDGVVFADHYCAGSVFAEEAFHLDLFGYFFRRHFVKGHLLPDDLVIGIVIGFEDVHLFFYLAAELSHYFFRLVDDDGEAMDAFRLGGGGVEALDIDLTAGEEDGDAVEQADLIFRVDRDGVLLLVRIHTFSFWAVGCGPAA